MSCRNDDGSTRLGKKVVSLQERLRKSEEQGSKLRGLFFAADQERTRLKDELEVCVAELGEAQEQHRRELREAQEENKRLRTALQQDRFQRGIEARKAAAAELAELKQAYEATVIGRKDVALNAENDRLRRALKRLRHIVKVQEEQLLLMVADLEAAHQALRAQARAPTHSTPPPRSRASPLAAPSSSAASTASPPSTASAPSAASPDSPTTAPCEACF